MNASSLPVPTEAQEGRTFVAYLRIKRYRFTHIANETGSGQSAKFQGIRNKQQGTSKGFPDYLIIVAGRLIAIELKRRKGGKVSPEQKDWLAALNAVGIEAVVCNGAAEAIAAVERFAPVREKVEF